MSRILKFGLVGASGVLVNLAVVWLGSEWLLRGVPGRVELAVALGILVSIFTNFVLNQAWTWGDRREHLGVRAITVRLARYYILAGAGGVLQWVAAWAGREVLGLDTLPASALAIAITTAANYVGSARWVFSREHAAQ